MNKYHPRDNTTITISFWALVLLAVAMIMGAALTGCGTLDSMYDREVVEEPGPIIGTNVVYRTNIVVIAAVTNQATGEVTPPQIQQVVQPEITYITAPPILRTNLVPRPSVTTSIGLSQMVPLPWVGFIGTGLTALYSIYAAARNKKTAQALVTGIEAGRKLLQETPEGQKLDAKIKDKLIEHQQLAGVIDIAAKLVQQYTTKTTVK